MADRTSPPTDTSEIGTRTRSADELQTLVIGCDAACLPVLEPLFERGAVPTLQSIAERGASGVLESQIPPWTASAWPSLYTGMNPGKHGVFDFLRFDGYDWEVVNASHVSERTLWELLDFHGYASVVVNAPVTYPVRPFDGALIPGYMAPETPKCHPEGLFDDVVEAIGGYRVYPDAPRGEHAREEYEAAAVEVTRMRGRAFRYLADRFEPDFGFVQFQMTDTVFHDHPGAMDLVEAIYRAVDEEVAEILETTRPQNVFLVSDHGVGRYDDHEFRVNEFLREHGYVTAVRGGRGMPTWATVRDENLKRGTDRTSEQRSILDRGMAAMATVGLTGQRVLGALETVRLDEVVLRHAPSRLVRAGRSATEQVDFAHSRAYMRSRTELGVRINLEGREPNGVVPRDAYESVRSALIELLEGVQTPEGVPVFEAVEPRETYFDGPAVEAAVDVVTVPADFEQYLSAKLSGSTFGPPTEPWNHTRDGFLGVVGEDVDESASFAEAHLFDVAPTVLATFGIGPDERMDGRTLPVVEAVPERSYPPRASASTVAIDDESVEERLADLGYLE